MSLNPYTINQFSLQLPVAVYESVIDLINGEATMLFIELQYTLATEEAERIGVDHVARMSTADTGESSSGKPSSTWWDYVFTALDKMFFSKSIDIFLISPQNSYVVGTLEWFGEALLMSTHNICFHGEIRKYLPDTQSYLDLWIMFCFCTKMYLLCTHWNYQGDSGAQWLSWYSIWFLIGRLWVWSLVSHTKDFKNCTSCSFTWRSALRK